MSTQASRLKQHWQAYSEALDRLLDLPDSEQQAWLDRQDFHAELKQLLSEALGAAKAQSLIDATLWQSDANPLVAPASRVPLWPRQIGPWRLLRPLGEGGSANVFLVERDLAGTRQEAALKLLRSGLLDPVEHDRFLAEQAVLARLKHPGIAHLIDGGISPEGAPYLVIEYINGQSITDWCMQHRIALNGRLALFQRALEAVHYAHRNLIVHRDLKPANIMVDSESHVKLLDFGIARPLSDNQDPTRTEARRLTLAYAAPEQLAGAAPTTAIDLYAMGVLLHELVTGDLPAGAHRTHLPNRTQRHLWVDGRGPDRGLQAIISMALAEDPEQRYESAAAFAEDLDRYRQHQPLRARGTSIWYQYGRALQQHWLKLAAFASVLLVVTASAWIARREAETAQALANRETATRKFLLDLLLQAAPEQVHGQPTDLATLIRNSGERARTAFPDAPATRAEVLRVSGQLLNSLGQLDAAEQNLRLALAIEQEQSATLGTGQAQTILALASVLRDRNRLHEATSLCTDLVRRLRASGEAPDTLAGALLLEGTLRSRGEQHEAGLALLQEGLSLIQSMPRLDPMRTAEAERQLGDALARMGQVESALPHWQQAVALVPEDSLLRSRLLLSMAYGALQIGDFDGADAHLQDVTRIHQHLRLDVHTDRAQTLTARAVLANVRGDERTALSLHEAALRIRERVFGPDSVEAGESQIAVAVSHRILGEFDTAFAAFEAGIARFKRAREPPSGQLAWAYSNYAAALSEAGAHTRAIATAERSLASLDDSFSLRNDTRHLFQLTYVTVLRKAGQYQPALALIANARTLPLRPSLIRRYDLAEAEIERDRGHLQQAILLYQTLAEETEPEHLPREHAEAWLALATLYEREQRPAEASAAKQRALSLFERVLPQDHPRWQDLRAATASRG